MNEVNKNFSFHDEWGPEYVIRVYDPKTSLKGILVIDNTVLGPGKGGIRMSANISEEEVFRLARTMTWKNALADIPFGGAKAGIIFQPQDSERKRELIQGFARAIKVFTPKKYIAGPDVNTGEREMQWFVEATGNWRTATGKPANLCMETFKNNGEKPRKSHQGETRGRCGIPHEFGSTGFGVAQATSVAARIYGLDIKNASVAIHGFGNVGSFAYRYLSDLGAKIIAIADRTGVIVNEHGFDREELEEFTDNKKELLHYKNAEHIPMDKFWSINSDILIPASITDVINQSNKGDIKAKIIVEAGNIPMREEVEKEFFKKGVLVVPDFVANAGGVISSYAEYRGYNPKKMFDLVEGKIVKATELVLKQSLKQKIEPRAVALNLAQEKVRRKMKKTSS